MEQRNLFYKMQAVILSGGKGTRLAPYTMILPKPLVPIGHKPILDIIVRQLSYFGFFDITLTLGYLSELIQAYFSTTNSIPSNLNLKYLRESKPLGTAGSLGLLKKKVNAPFLVMNGDILTSLDYKNVYDYHCEKKSILTIATYKKLVKIDLGIIKADNNNNISDYIEKPEEYYNVSMGVYIYSPEVLDYITVNEYLDFPDLVLRLIRNGEHVSCYPSDSFWLDIGRPEDLARAQEKFEQMKNTFLPGEFGKY